MTGKGENQNSVLPIMYNTTIDPFILRPSEKFKILDLNLLNLHPNVIN